MSINYIKENIKKIDHDNLISFLFDIIIRGGLDDIEDFNNEKIYHIHEKIYYKDSKGMHHIYKCKVDSSTPGSIIDDEWVDLLQSFRKPIISEDTIITSIDIREEVIVAEKTNQKEFRLDTAGVEDGLYTVIVFHPELGRLAQSDFEVSGRTIVLNDDCIVENIGDRIIVDLYQKM